MDYKIYLAGQKNANFWFKAKNGLIDVLFSKLHKKNLKILSVGSGTGDDLKILNKYGDVYVTDISKKALMAIPNKLCKEKITCDVCNIPYPDKFFDIVTAFDVFEHVTDDKLAISEVHRVLKKGGKVLFTVPAFQFLYSGHDKAVNHKRRYTKRMLYALFKIFTKVKLGYWNSLLFLPVCINRLSHKNSVRVDNQNLPKLLNYLFYKLLSFENKLIKNNFKLPLGLSIYGIYEK